MSLSQTVLKILNAVKKMVAVLTKFKNTISEDSKALIIVVAFIGWIAVSNYKDKHGKVEDGTGPSPAPAPVPAPVNIVNSVCNAEQIVQ
jgi:hypothetical protein